MLEIGRKRWSQTFELRDTAKAMTAANVEIARRLYPGPVDYVAALVDPRAAEATRAVVEPLLDPDVEIVTVPGQVPLGASDPENPAQPTVYGFDGLVGASRDWLGAWELWEVSASDYIDVDDARVFVMLDIRVRSKTDQVEIPITGASVLTFGDGRIRRIQLFFDRVQALHTAGLDG